MAFQTGTQVRPELGRADVSGFAKAGMITGQSLANLGAQVGGAIKEYKQDKEKKAQDKAYDEVLVGLAQDEESRLGASLRELGVTDKETAGIVRKSLGDKFEPTLNMLMQIEAEAQQFQPEVFTIGEGEDAVRVLRTSKGQVQLLKGEEDMGQKTPTSVLESEYKRKKLAEAQELYSQGRTREAQNITTSIGYINELTGFPIPVSEVFKDIKPNSDPDPTPEPEPTPEPAPTPKSGFRIVP